MRVLLASLILLCCALVPGYSEEPTPPATPICTIAKPQDCGVSPKVLKQARQEYKRAKKLQKHHPEQALEALQNAANLVPRNTDYVMAREVLRQELIYEHLRRGNELLVQQRRIEAAREFRQALKLDPNDRYAAERLRQIVPAVGPSPRPGFIQSVADGGTIKLSPKPIRPSFHLVSNARSLLTNVASTFGIQVDFDPSASNRSARLDLDHVDFTQAMDAACLVTNTFWMPTSPTTVLIAADTPAQHRELDRYVLRTFYLPEVNSPQALNDITNLLRTVFEIRYVAQQPASSSIIVRAPADVVEAASHLLESMSSGRPAVMVDFQAFEIDHTLMRNIGVNMPLQFNVFNIPAAALAALTGGGSNVQDLINQLIASGGINQANSTAISALVAQLQSQQSSLSSLFQNPVATFGGGKTLMGIGVPPTTLNFSRNESYIKSLEHVTLRAAQGDTATLRIGERYPILNASYAPVFNTPQVSSILANNSYVAPFPSFNYEDLGLTLKTKPQVHGTTDVTLDLDMSIRSLGAQSFNGVPVILQRAYKGVISLKDGEPAVVAGALTNSELLTLTGLPGISHVPILNYATSNQSKQFENDELLIVVTPHIISAGFNGGPPAIVLPPTTR